MDGKCHYRRPQTSVRGKFSFHYSNDHKMSAYCSFFNILVSSPPAAGLIFCTILAKLLAVRINLLWILFALGLLPHAAGSWSRKHEIKVNAYYAYYASNWLSFIQQPINKKSGKGHMSLLARYLLLVSVPLSLTTCHSAECFLLSFIAKVGHFLQHPPPKCKSHNLKAKEHVKISFTPALFNFYYDFGFGFVSAEHKLISLFNILWF